MKGVIGFFLGFSLINLFFFFPSQILGEDRYALERKQMVKSDIKARGIKDSRVIGAMEKVERHLFVGEALRGDAYADHPLPIGEGQTISQPYIVALMTELVGVKKGDKILEIGTGSGYQAAVLSEITPHVYTIEIRKSLSDRASSRLKELGFSTVRVKNDDGYFGWEEYAPFDAIMITAAANHIPPMLLKQLKDGGRLVLPLGSTTYYQTLTVVTKKGVEFDAEHVMGVSFVPMVGEVLKK